MKIVKSSRDTFRYLWARNDQDKSTPKYLAARNVAVGHLPADETAPRMRAIVDNNLKHITTPGSLQLVELGEAADYRYSAMLAPLIKAVTGARRPRFIFPSVGLVNGGTEFHVDMPMMSSVFGAWCLSGPDRVVRFSELGIEVPFTPGTVLLFDPAQPHALLKPGCTEFDPADYGPNETCVLLSFCFRKTPKACQSLDIDVYGPRKHKDVRKTVKQYEPDGRNGALVFQ